ncbi:ATP-dependent DNA helicase [Pleurotus pulmonarius]
MLRHDFLILSIALRYDVVWPPRQRRPCKKIFTTVEPHRAYERPELMGGGKQPLTFGVVSPFLRVEAESFEPGVALEIVTFASSQTTSAAQTSAGELWGVVPLKMLLPFCMKYHLLALTKLHDMTVPGSKRTVDKLIELLISHVCDGCPEVHTLFRIKASAVKPHITKQDWSEARKLENKKRLTEGTLNSRSIERSMLKHVFPPPPPSALLQDTICSDYCKAFDPDVWEEGACMVCAELKPHSQLSRIDQCPTLNLALLKRDGVTRVQRVQDTDDICEISSPIVLPNVDKVCTKCEADLRSSRVPKYSLASGLWIGEVPDVLSRLSFAEKLLVARVRHNSCVVRVASGRLKMAANAILFQNPSVKIYHKLPPSREELSEVLAIVFIGESKPTREDYERTPLLVRRNFVAEALLWLKLNHVDYHDLTISAENLATYPLAGVPVHVDFRKRDGEGNKELLTQSVYDHDIEQGTSSGPCSFAVSGLTGGEYETMSIEALRAKALNHLTEHGKVLVVGRSAQPESLYDNPQLYPQMFPWLFPFGFGGFGNERLATPVSDTAHKRHLLMYHDKRFQTDPFFPIVAFNHDQIKAATTASFVVASRQSFEKIVSRIKALDANVLHRLADRMKEGERVVPENAAEQACFDVMSDVDQIGGHVQGSITSKKSMRNEIWSLMSFMGAPSWFITFSPADVMSPLCIYFAQTDQEYSPTLLSREIRERAIALNPVAAARFFHFVCQTFISCVLGVGLDRPGLYGETSAYYGVVEQQGRLTLHLHMLLWIRGNLSPQIVRERLDEQDGEFKRRLIEYLEGCHQGDFMEGDLEDVRARVPVTRTAAKKNVVTTIPKAFLPLEKEGYEAPTETLPEGPPVTACQACGYCPSCQPLLRWRERVKSIIDDILLRSNVHSCYASNKGNNPSGQKTSKGCMRANGTCAARFPRDLVEKTTVTSDGHVLMRKKEPMLNTFTPLVTYLLRGNTDVTSLLSGTAVKAVVMYVTDYITKQGLKTYQIFDAVADVLRRSAMSPQEQVRQDHGGMARKILLKVVNNLTSKSEIGSPMACMYLLGHPDHYTSHRFVKLWWRSFVAVGWKHFSVSEESVDGDDILEDTVRIGKVGEAYVSISTTDDYLFHPKELAHLNVYEWTQMCERVSISSESSMESDSHDNDVSAGGCDDFLQDWQTLCDRAKAKTDWSFKEYFVAEGDVDELRPYTGQFKKSKPMSFRFLPGHPLRKTHLVKYHPSRRNWVPDFKGGQLPRSDQGNREYYCAAMLALFKPWYLAENLKRVEQTWDEAFGEYVFTDRQRQVLANFDLRYECLDERDDFRARDVGTPRRLDVDGQDDGCNDQYDLAAGNDVDDDFDGPDELSTYMDMNGTAREHQRKMDEISVTMGSAGWLKSVPAAVEPCSEEILRQSPAKWTKCIKSLRDMVVTSKAQTTPSDITHLSQAENKCQQQGFVAITDSAGLQALSMDRTFRLRKVLESVCEEFSLNPEQSRAFRMVAEHAIAESPPQLKMYLGGMAGTGKSRVLKALTEFLSRLGQSHRLAIVGPTGSCAALIGGSTYHSVLGFNGPESEHSSALTRSIAQVRSRLQGVDYIFLDEVSMVSCRDLCRISGRLAEVRHLADVPFGGMNMILAGDFTQLPPVGGHPLYDAFVGPLSARMSKVEQESRLGRALWLQFVSVVMLKSNMRQRLQSKEDECLRVALSHMRYCDCTDEDVAFLKSLVSTRARPNRSLGDREFRDAPVITAWNLQKDRINKLGTTRFAADTGQALQVFHSLDVLADQMQRGARQKETSPKNLRMTTSLQTALWQCEHSETEHVAGTLLVCKGLPVVLRHNYATELCMTKGQDAVMVDWDFSISDNGVHALDTLYVRLQDPPREVRIAGLPTNVVPLVRRTVTVRCLLPNGATVTVKRSQIPVLPNFAMTDYASQGKTRRVNVVDLQNCKNHLAVYTCLSRSADACHTLIVQGFDAKKISGGRTVKFLRAELRELEALDEASKAVTALGGLPGPVFETRSEVLAWSKSRLVPSSPSVKRRLSNEEGPSIRAASSNKRARTRPVGPLGLEWDEINFSCAYDAVLTILFNAWRCDKGVLDNVEGRNAKKLRHGFERVIDSEDFRRLRDALRTRLHKDEPSKFPYGQACIAVSDVYYALFAPTTTWTETVYHCRACRTGVTTITHSWASTSSVVSRSPKPSIRDWLVAHLNPIPTPCPICQGCTEANVRLRDDVERLGLAAFALTGDNWYCEPRIDLSIGDRAVLLDLKGIVFWNASHFTAIVVDDTKVAWFHDGMTTKATCRKLGEISDWTPLHQLGVVGIPVLAIYSAETVLAWSETFNHSA